MAGRRVGAGGGVNVCHDAPVSPDGAFAQPGASLTIRARTDVDLEECARLLREVHLRDAYPMTWPAHPAAWLAGHDQIAAWVAMLDGRLAGHVSLSAIAPSDLATHLFGGGAVKVSRLFVATAARGHGTGTALLRHAVRAARERQLRPVLEVQADSEPAVTFYERLGWRLLGSLNQQWGPHLVPVRCYAAPD